MRTADEIDPEVTQADVPSSIGKHLSIGTTDSLISSSFGMFEQLAGKGVLDLETKQRIPELLLEFAVSAAELSFARTIYQGEVSKFSSDWDTGASKPTVDGTTVHIPTIDCFEVSFGIFYSSAKRAIGKLLSVLEWACGFETKYGTHLDKLIQRIRADKKLKHLHEIIGRLDGFVDAIQLLNELRNNFEHPSPSRNVQLKNISLRPEGGVLMPTWTLIHDKFDMPENQDYGIHLDVITDMISRLAEQVILVAAVARDDFKVVWEATVVEEKKIRADFPCRWKVSILGFAAQR